MSRISIIHYLKLIFRSCLFMVATGIYILNRYNGSGKLFGGLESRPDVLLVIWILFLIEMLLRFFPSKIESMGCQKQFKHNYIPSANEEEIESHKSIIWVAAFWVALNSVIGVLYYAGVFDAGMLVLISLAFAVCDMICILFFCPFQTWIMKNKCCTSCRIYNWDYAMMFTPLLFVKNVFALSLLFFAVVLLLRWEISAHMHPERFSDITNMCLSCSHCEEKLCHHKKQLRHFLVCNKKKLHLKGNIVLKKCEKIKHLHKD